MSPGAAPPLPSQLKVHFSFCSTNLWLIVESFVSFDLVYPCCCIVCDLPTELSRSHHCLTLTSSGWDTLQKLQTSVKTEIIVIHQAIYVPVMDCNLICPMQVRMNDVKLDDKPKLLTEDPTNESHAISCEDNTGTLINIALELKGVTSSFPHKEANQA